MGTSSFTSIIFVALLQVSHWKCAEARDGCEAIYLGCYKDTRQRDLPIRARVNGFIECMLHCNALKYRYAGLQIQTQCWCGNSYGRHGQMNDIKCKPCTHLPGHTCGGTWRNSIYEYRCQYYILTSRVMNDPFSDSNGLNSITLDQVKSQNVISEMACLRICQTIRRNTVGGKDCKGIAVGTGATTGLMDCYILEQEAFLHALTRYQHLSVYPLEDTEYCRIP